MDSTITAFEDNAVMNKSEFSKKTGLGERLRCARETMQLTRKEVAARLHLNVNMIALIENENFMDGPPATFMRGYLRSYARLLNFPENEITLALKSVENAIPANKTIVITPAQPIKPYERYFHWLAYFILFVLAVLVTVWWTSHSRYTTADATLAPISSQQTAISPQNTTPSTALMAPANPGTLPSSASKLTLPSAPTIQQPPVPAAKKPAISDLGIALPEPGSGND